MTDQFMTTLRISDRSMYRVAKTESESKEEEVSPAEVEQKEKEQQDGEQ